MELYQYIIIMVVLLIIALAIVKMNKKNIKLEFNKLVDLLGGKDNILDTEVEMSRFKVTLKDNHTMQILVDTTEDLTLEQALFGEKAEFLSQLATYIKNRNK